MTLLRIHHHINYPFMGYKLNSTDIQLATKEVATITVILRGVRFFNVKYNLTLKAPSPTLFTVYPWHKSYNVN